MTAKQTIGWIGAGKMGLPICKRLKAAGHEVKVLVRRPAQAEAMASLGFVSANSIAETILGANVVFTSVTDDKALADVASCVRTSSLPSHHMLCSSISAPYHQPSLPKIAARLPKTNGYLRSPVSGSTGMAEAGTLTALVSGPKSAFDSHGRRLCDLHQEGLPSRRC